MMFLLYRTLHVSCKETSIIQQCWGPDILIAVDRIKYVASGTLTSSKKNMLIKFTKRMCSASISSIYHTKKKTCLIKFTKLMCCASISSIYRRPLTVDLYFEVFDMLLTSDLYDVRVCTLIHASDLWCTPYISCRTMMFLYY